MLASVIASTRRRLDPLTVAYAAASGATSLAGIDAIMRYARAESLLNNIRLYLMKSAQNAGTGATAYGIGSLTANNMTLVNGPTWGAGGVAFTAASSHYGTIGDFIDGQTLNLFLRGTMTPSGTTVFASQYNTSADRSWLFRSRGSPFSHNISADATAFATYDGSTTGSGTDACHVATYASNGAVSYWANKTSQTLTLGAGSAQAGRFNATSNVIIAAFLNAGSPSGFASMTANTIAFVMGALTTTQRETLTDLINAL